MSAHVAPHRWADAWAGKLPEPERVAMERHAEQCKACARARDRVTSASNSFSAIRTQSAPEISWDAVRARVHWSHASERRARPHGPRRLVIGLWVVAAAGVTALVLASGSQLPRRSSPVVATPDRPLVPAAVAPTPLAGLVSRLAGEVMIDGVRRTDAFDRAIHPGARLATADGRVDVQFGEHSAFALGPRSSLELRRFDVHAIELVVEGTVDVEVAARAPGERFVVIAGAQTIEVRGTQFRVVHEGARTSVSCRHGLVAVRDARGELEVAAARKVDVRAAVGDAHVLEMSKAELAELAQATPHTVTAWTDADALARGSAPLEIATVGHRDVRVDGIELGQAPLRVRVMPGRHTVEVERGGRFRRAGWVDVTTGTAARFEVIPVEDAVPTGGVDVRQKQFHAGIDWARINRCGVRVVAKQDLPTYVEIDIAVDASGAVSYLNILQTDFGAQNTSCIHDVLADIPFAAGPAAAWREKLAL